MKNFLFFFLFLSVGAMAKDVEVYDFDTQKVYLMPEEKLGASMVRINLDGKLYWASSNQLKQGEFQHPVFDGELKEKILNIQRELTLINPQTYAEWEDGFRRDHNPKNEIAIWEHIIQTYSKFSKNVEDLEAKKEIYKIAVICSYSQKSVVLSQAKVKIISSETARAIVDEYYK